MNDSSTASASVSSPASAFVRGGAKGLSLLLSIALVASSFSLGGCSSDAGTDEEEASSSASAVSDGTEHISRSFDQMQEGLVAAELCLAMNAAAIVLIRSPGILEKIAKVIVKVDDKAKAVMVAYGVGENTAKILVTLAEAKAGSSALKVVKDFYLKTCGRGLEEIGKAIEDVGPATNIVVSGTDTGREGELALPQSNPIRVARECWDGAYRGVYCSKRCSAKECCDARFAGDAKGAQACKNNVDTIADNSGW